MLCFINIWLGVKKKRGEALLVSDLPNANSTTDTDTQAISDKGETMANLCYGTQHNIY